MRWRRIDDSAFRPGREAKRRHAVTFGTHRHRGRDI